MDFRNKKFTLSVDVAFESWYTHGEHLRKGGISVNRALIAQRLIHLRGKRTQAEVAKAVHISKSALSSYESGARMPRDEVKIALSKLYGKSVHEIFFA